MKVLIDMPPHNFYLEKLRTFPEIEITLVKAAEVERELPKDLIKDCDILFSTFLPSNHEEMDSLKWIQISSAGYRQLLGKRLPERGIIASNALGVFDVPIAEWNISMMINLARDMKQMIYNQNHAIWDRSPKFQNEIRGKTVGIWGYGGIGRETARLANALGMQVHVMTRNGLSERSRTYTVANTGDVTAALPDRVFSISSRQEFLSGLDFLVLALPHTKETEGMIGEAELRCLKGAFVLNPARGALIQEGALLSALSEGWIAGAALDTHYHYPMPKEHPLWALPNVIMTPHISGSSANPRFLDRVWEIFSQNLRNFINGDQLMNRLLNSQLSE